MDENIIKIYYETFLEDEYDFNGIILTPHLNREEDRIDWEVDNPQKVSVSKSRIIDYIHDIFFEFCKYVGSGPKGQRAIYDSLQRAATNIVSTFTFPGGNVFLNQKDKIKLLLILTSIKQIVYTIRGGNKYIFDIEIDDFSLDNSYTDDFYCGFKVKFLSGTKNGEEIKDSEIKKSIGDVFREDDFFDYQNNLMLPFWEPIVNNPLLFELRETYYTNDFIPYDRNGKRIIVDY
jgi:hypothetical protein